MTIQVQPAGAAEAHADDIAAITELVARVQAAQQAEDVDGFVGEFQRDTVWTTAHGKRIVGRDAIESFTRAVLPGAMRESTATYDVEHVLFVRPDVAVVNLRQCPVRLDGTPLEGVPEGRPVYVLVRDDTGIAPGAGAWRIAAGQNTQVHAG